jgi:hemerythrin-like domain-containing protein
VYGIEVDMEPIGALMWEHRTIEKALSLLEKEMDRTRSKGKINHRFLEQAMDFFHSYADRTHHGKEEDILFVELSQKQLSDEHRKTMDGLKKDHVRGRELIGQISDALKTGKGETAEEVNNVTLAIEGLLELYPQHIEKEDKHFFYPVLDYFDKEERKEMLQKFYEFDRQLIHDLYKMVLEEMEKVL